MRSKYMNKLVKFYITHSIDFVYIFALFMALLNVNMSCCKHISYSIPILLCIVFMIDTLISSVIYFRLCFLLDTTFDFVQISTSNRLGVGIHASTVRLGIGCLSELTEHLRK